MGIGKLLMDDLIKECLNRGLSYARLNATPTSKSFYENLGFQLVERKFYIEGDEKSDYFEMKKKIKF